MAPRLYYPPSGRRSVARRSERFRRSVARRDDDLVERLHQRSAAMLGYVMVAMGSCVIVAAVAILMEFGMVATVLLCWLSANVVFVVVALATSTPPPLD